MKVKRLTESAKLPTRAHQGDAGLDLYADEDAILDIGVVTKVKTGIAIELPYGTVGRIVDKSSKGSNGIHTLAGVIDSSYRGEVVVVLTLIGLSDIKDYYEDTTQYKIQKGDKIAQLLVLPILLPEPYEVQELTDTTRGDNGFGSTGR